MLSIPTVVKDFEKNGTLAHTNYNPSKKLERFFQKGILCQILAGQKFVAKFLEVPCTACIFLCKNLVVFVFLTRRIIQEIHCKHFGED